MKKFGQHAGAQRLKPSHCTWRADSSTSGAEENYTPGPPVLTNWKMPRSRRKALGLALCLGEMVFFFEIFDFRTGLSFGGRRMQAVLLEHLVEIGPVTAGELGRS